MQSPPTPGLIKNGEKYLILFTWFFVNSMGFRKKVERITLSGILF
jgi:hypothetical protein